MLAIMTKPRVQGIRLRSGSLRAYPGRSACQGGKPAIPESASQRNHRQGQPAYKVQISEGKHLIMNALRIKSAKQDAYGIESLARGIPGTRSGSRQKSAKGAVTQRPGQCPGHGEGPNSEQVPVIIDSGSQGRPSQYSCLARYEPAVPRMAAAIQPRIGEEAHSPIYRSPRLRRLG